MSDSVGSVSVTVVPDARGWSEKLRAQLRDQVVKVHMDADTGEAAAKIDEAARDRTSEIHVKADTSQLSKGASALDNFVGKLGLLPALAIAGGSALIPLAGALGGVVAALAAPLAIAGGGATLFGILAGFAVKDTEKQLKAIDSLQKKLDGMTKGTAEYAQAQKELHDAQKSLSPAQTAFSNAQGGLAASFQNFIGGKAGVALLGPLTQGMKLLGQILPSLTPVLVAAGGAFSNLLSDLGRATSSPGFSKFIHMVSGQVGHDIEGFGHVLGNVAKGLGGLFVSLDKSVGSSMVDTLERLTGSFAKWANSDKGRKSVQSFLDYFHEVGPQVAHTIGAVARAMGKIVEALAPLGPVVLGGIQLMAEGISKIPIPVLTALAGAFIAMVGFQKVGGFKGLALLGKLGGGGGLTKGGLLGGLMGGKSGVVPVFVTNEGFGGPGGAAGGKSALPTVAAGAAGASRFARFGAGVARFGEMFAAPAFVGVGGTETGTHALPGGGTSPNLGTQFRIPPSGKLPTSIPGDVTKATSALAAMKEQAARASHALDLIGPRAAAMSGTAVRALGAMVTRPNASLDAVQGGARRALVSLGLIGPHTQAASGVATHAIGGVSSKLGQLGQTHARPKIDVNSGAALSQIQSVQSALAGIERVVNVHINVTKSTNALLADVNTPKHALGGYIAGRGTGTSDSIPSWLSNGEFVVNAHATAHNRALLEQLNSGRRPTYTPASAGSGAGSLRVIEGKVDIDTGRIRALAREEYDANAAYEAARHGR